MDEATRTDGTKAEKAKVDGARAEGDRQGIQVLARAAAILRALETEPDGLSLGEIASRVGLARSTVQRIVSTLADEQVLIAATPKARVKLGPLITRLASSVNLDIAPLARPVMQALSRSLRETVDLSILKGGAAVFVEQVQGSHRLAAISAVGEEFPLYCTANGKAMLALLPAEKRRQLLSGALPRLTPNTRTDPAEILREIEAAGPTGTAWDIEEHGEGVCAAGVAFTDMLGRLFALSVPVPTPRFAAQKEALSDALQNARQEILALLQGGRS